MALYVNTNVSSINAQRKLTNATNSLNVSYQRLASGFRINSAKDDAAGLMISDRLTSQINGLNQGNRNANDGIALAQTIEGALDETTNMLQRIRTLAVQSSNGTNAQQDREALQQEVDQLCAEINRIAKDTTFAGEQILDGAGEGLIPANGNLIFHVGSNKDNRITLEWNEGFTISGIAEIAGNITISNLVTADQSRGMYQPVQNSNAQATIRNQSNISENESDARSRIRDTDFASETAALTQNNIIQQASQTVLAQANQRPTIALSLLGQ